MAPPKQLSKFDEIPNRGTFGAQLVDDVGGVLVSHP